MGHVKEGRRVPVPGLLAPCPGTLLLFAAPFPLGCPRSHPHKPLPEEQ